MRLELCGRHRPIPAYPVGVTTDPPPCPGPGHGLMACERRPVAPASDPPFIVMPKDGPGDQLRRSVVTHTPNQSPPRWRALDTAAE